MLRLLQTALHLCWLSMQLLELVRHSYDGLKVVKVDKRIEVPHRLLLTDVIGKIPITQRAGLPQAYTFAVCDVPKFLT